MKTVLITGCSSGIGLSTALEFARNGFQVIATMRNLDKAAKLQKIAEDENLAIDIKQLDVTQVDLIGSFIENILDEYKKLDVLINNAGAGLLGTLEQTSLAEAQAVMNINFFGTWNMTKAVLPSMRSNKAGRIISVTSMGGVMGQPFNDIYCAAKFAVEGMMESLAPVLKRLGIHISLVEPGPVNSEFASSTLDNSPELRVDLQKDYKSMLDSYCEGAKVAFSRFAQSPDEVAKIMVEIAKDASPSLRYQTSEISKKIASTKFADPTGNQCVALSGSRLPEVIA